MQTWGRLIGIVGLTCGALVAAPAAHCADPGENGKMSSRRAVWALDRLRVYDGGPDEDADTAADNSPFAAQGVFVP